jgi:hypothetical protein
MDVININSSDDEDDDDDLSLFPDEEEDPADDEAEDPRAVVADISPEAKAEAAILARIPSFGCPISHGLFKDPVLCSDGFTYERPDINRWFKIKGESPMTRAPISNTHQYPNYALRNVITEFTRDNEEIQNKLKESEEAQKQLELKIKLTKVMLDAAMKIIEKWDSEKAIMAEKIQTDADTKWKLVVDETKKKGEMKIAALDNELVAEKSEGHKIRMENKKLNSKLKKNEEKLKEAQAKRKSMVDKMKEIVGENEMATTNPKSNKKAKRS